MMSLRFFLRDRRASSFESFALAMSVIAVLFIAAADLLHYAAKKNNVLAEWLGSVHIEFAHADEHPLRGRIDYTETGSVTGPQEHLPRLDPCTGAAR